MATATQSFTCRLTPAAVEAIRRLSAISGLPMARLIEIHALSLQDLWFGRFTASERHRYEQKIMSRIEALEIRRRSASMKGPADGAGARGQPRIDGPEEDRLPDAAPANANTAASKEDAA
jgi:hypothetical protein